MQDEVTYSHYAHLDRIRKTTTYLQYVQHLLSSTNATQEELTKVNVYILSKENKIY